MKKPPAPQPTKITRDDWLAALEETRANEVDRDPSLLSYDEFASLMGIARATAVKRLNELVEAGRAVRSVKRILAPDGRIRAVVAYRLKKP